MTNETTLSDLERQYDRANERFNTFVTKREAWRNLLIRNYPPQLPPELIGIADYLDYETPDIERASNQIVAILTMNPTDFDVAVLEEGEQAKKWGEDIALWTASMWANVLNVARTWDKRTAEAAGRYGVGISRLLWRKQEDTKEQPEEDADKYLKRREKEQMRKRSREFFLDDTHPLSCCWLERGGEPDILFHKFELQSIEAYGRYDRPGETERGEEKGKTYRPLVDRVGKLRWIGEDTPADWGDGNVAQGTVKVLIREARDLKAADCPICHKHKPWKIAEYIYSGTAIKEAQKVREYDSPFPGPTYMITPAYDSGDRDPDLRYRPPLLPLYVEAQWFNYLTTVIAALARKEASDESVTIDFSKAPPGFVWFNEGPEKWFIDKPEPGSKKIIGIPGKLEAWPNVQREHLLLMLEASTTRMQSYMPNRFLVGAAGEEAKEATGTAFLQQVQGAAVEFKMPLANMDSTVKRIFEYIYHAMRYWDELGEGVQAGTKYFLAASGGERLRSREVESGEVVFISADKLAIEFDLVTETRSETLAEQGARWAQAKDKHAYGALTDEQLYREAGQRDVDGFKRQKRKELLKRHLEPMKLQIETQIVQTLTLARLGINPMAPPPPALGPGGGNGTQPPAESVGAMTGRQLQAPLVDGVSGGSSPV